MTAKEWYNDRKSEEFLEPIPFEESLQEPSFEERLSGDAPGENANFFGINEN